MTPTITLTATGKEAALVEFYKQLRRDGMTATDLAAKAGVGRAYLTLVLNGHRTGKNTWKHVLPQLTPAALFLLKQCSAWNNHAAQALQIIEACRATNQHFAKVIEDHASDFGVVKVLPHPLLREPSLSP